MKKYLITLFAILFAVAAFAGDHGKGKGKDRDKADKPKHNTEIKIKKKDIPPAVLESFTKSYPTAKVKKCTKEEEDGKLLYEVEAKDGDVKRSIVYTADGKVMETEVSVKPHEVPGAIKDAVKAEYPKGKIHRAMKIDDGGAIMYELVIKRGWKKFEIEVDPKGNIQK